jgi:FkbM family methyltransferase
MYQAHGWWFPDQDTHFVEMLSKNIAKGNSPVYQEPVRRRSVAMCSQRRIALDIGANVGLWSRDLCQEFAHVIAFEPVADFRQCLEKNVTTPNFQIQPVALGSQTTMIDMVITEQNTGHSHVDTDSIGKGQIPMITLDSMNLLDIDYVKIDCEGYEHQILLGAQNTIMTNRPVLVVEDKKHKDVGHGDTDQAVDLLLSWGARILSRVNNDVVIGW